MDTLKKYKSIDELQKSFNVTFIEDVCSLNDFIHYSETGCVTLYRGENSPTYRLYNSAQRFYCDNRDRIGNMTYSDFIDNLYKMSYRLHKSFFSREYSKVSDCNKISFNGEQRFLNYNPLWAFCALQHYADCSPLIDFTINPLVALFFASLVKQKYMLPIMKRKYDINDYIAIVYFHEPNNLLNTFNLSSENIYGSFVEYLLEPIERNDEKSLSNAVQAITQAKLEDCTASRILYIAYGSNVQKLAGNDLDYQISLQNKNIVPQEGRLFLMDSEKKPFEEMWNESISSYRNNSKLEIALINKKLLPFIYGILKSEGFNKQMLMPISLNLNDEILEFLKSPKLL